MAKTRSTLNADVAPSNEVPSTQEVEISVKSGTAPVENLLVVDPTALNEIKNEMKTGSQVGFTNSYMVMRAGVTFDGVPAEITNPKRRIPAAVVTKKNTILIFSDVRKIAFDQTFIVNGCSRSITNGVKWEHLVTSTCDGNGDVRRVMDSTVLYDEVSGRVWLLLGRWTAGKNNWCTSARDGNGVSTPDRWVSDGKKASISYSDDEGANWVQKTLSPEANSDTNIQILGMPADCKGFLGGVGAGIRMSDGTLVFPIQWTKGNRDVYSTVIYKRSNEDVFRWCQSNIQDAPVSPSLTWGSAEHMVVEMPDGSLVSLSRHAGAGASNAIPKRAFRLPSLDGTWELYAPLDKKIPKGAECQGSFIKITTAKGITTYLITAPSCVSHDQSYRSGIAVYVFNYNESNPNESTVVPIYALTAKQSAGYSCLAYSKTSAGEKLIAAYEVYDPFSTESDPESIAVEDITFLIPRIENIVSPNLNEISSVFEKIKPDYVKDGLVCLLSTENFDKTGSTANWRSSVGGDVFTSVSQNGSNAGTAHTGITVDDDPRLLKFDNTGTTKYGMGMAVGASHAIKMKDGSPATEMSIQFLFKITSISNDWVITLGTGPNNGFTGARDVSLGFNLKSSRDQFMATGGMNRTPDACSFNSGFVFELNKVYNVAITYGDTCKIYVDGVLIQTEEKNPAKADWNIANVTMMGIGAKFSGVSALWTSNASTNVSYGEILYYNRELSQTEVISNCGYSKGENPTSSLSNAAYEKVNSLNTVVEETKDSLVSQINDLKFEMLRLKNPNALLFNIPVGGFRTGAPSYGDIDASPYTLKLFKGKDEVSDIPAASGTTDSDFGVYEGGLFIGKSIAPVGFKLGDETFTGSEQWTIKFKLRVVGAGFSQWKQLFYMTEDGANTATGINQDNYQNTVKGSNTVKAFRLETSTTQTLTLEVYSGNNGSGVCLSNTNSNIGRYDAGLDYDFMIVSDGTNVIIYGENGKVVNTFTNSPTLRIFGFNGLNFGNVLLKELRVFKGYAAKESELKIL